MNGLAMLTLFIYLVVFCAQGAVWGWAVKKVVENKGYQEDWFWWGFFFGFIALIVALTKPDIPKTPDESSSYFRDSSSIVGKNYVFKGFGAERKADYTKREWRCTHCGKVNAGYVGTCGCGCDKSGNMPVRETGQIQQEEQQKILFCTSCGKPIEDGAKFCRYCGAEIRM